MKHRVLKLTIVLVIILSIMTSTFAYALGNVVYTNTRMLADNLEYINTISWHSTHGRTESFAIRTTGEGDAYPIVLNGDTIYGSTRISSMVTYAERLGMNVLAVANADFFYTDSGVPLGIVIENGAYRSSPLGRPAVCFDKNGGISIVETPSIGIRLYNEGGSAEANNAGKSVNFSNLNKPRANRGGLCLFTEDFSSVSTRTSSPGWFVRFNILEGTPTVSGTMKLQVTEKLRSNGAVPIGQGNMILTAADESGHGAHYESFSVGDIVTLTTTCTDERLLNAAYATGGGDVLVADGVKRPSSSWSSSLRTGRAPRTAVGIKEDGSIVTYVLDGRNSDHSIGMTLSELADEMMRMGCVYAVNLDGGGSTALSVRIPGDSRAGVVSKPSDGSERGCATYILFVTDALSNGRAANLSLRNNGTVVLAGSGINLTFAATDGGYKPVAVPNDIQVIPYSHDGYISGTRFTAGYSEGPQTVGLYSPSTGAAGIGEIYVITRPTSLTVSRSGSSTQLQSVRLSPGETLTLGIAATYYRHAVTLQPQSFSYSVTGNIGEMTSPGVFKAGEIRGETGTIRVSVSDRIHDIRVEVGVFTDMINHWSANNVYYLANRGIVTGINATQFAPNQDMRRCDYVLMLYRAAGTPAVGNITSFDDVPQDSYYARAVAWAKQTGILDSVTGRNFRPEEALNRQDAMTFTYHALKLFNIQYINGTAADLARFPDAGDLAEYAVIPAATLVLMGIIEGADGLLIPRDIMSRAQMAKVIAEVLQRQ